MEGIKRLILVKVPTSVCNFRCHYCYLSHSGKAYQGGQAQFQYSPEYVAKAFSKERLGGVCYFNFCADGETLLTKRIDEYMKAIIEEGHYAEIVSNMAITSMIDKICAWPEDLRKRTEFKASFHWLELKKRNMLDTFTKNVKKCWDLGISVSIEITPSDELIPYIDEVIAYSEEHFGAKPHLTIARNDATRKIEYLTKLSQKEYIETWKRFNSPFWEYKRSLFGKYQKTFCYAGVNSLYVQITDGFARACYKSMYWQNIFNDLSKPIKWVACGKCLQPHCYNGHMLLTLGGCTGSDFIYVKSGRDIRDRTRPDGSHWLFPEVLEFFNTSAAENNDNHFSIPKKINTLLLNFLHGSINVPKYAIHIVRKKIKFRER